MSLCEITLSTTPTPEAIADLCLGDVVYLDGLMYTDYQRRNTVEWESQRGAAE